MKPDFFFLLQLRRAGLHAQIKAVMFTLVHVSLKKPAFKRGGGGGLASHAVIFRGVVLPSSRG